MAAVKFKRKAEREAHLYRVSVLYLQCWPLYKIGSELGVSGQQITYDVAELNRRWQAKQIEHIGARRTRELAKIDRVESEAWAAWERSKEDAETRIQKVRAAETGGQRQPVEATVRTEGQCGDVAYLNTILKCVEDRRKMFGLDAPEKHEVRGNIIHRPGLPELSDDELINIVRAGGNGALAPPDGPAQPDPLLSASSRTRGEKEKPRQARGRSAA